MLRLFTTWLILLLITAVSLKAGAAGAMMAAGCQHHAAQSSAAAHSAGTQAENKTPAKHPACGACSSFCLGELMPPCLALPAAACSGAQQVTIATATLLTGFIPDGPRRPPRPLSA
ncbi:hypothetical protein [Janthinobacterium sp. ROICE36]|uniref:hypothetical protein n=1 Tax=Janthinobacterium sp. ROICE36 TaxID=2048670 RepID=UPI0011AEF664|nr:hypothetical protein [Janthinobacterium sp. ROICE36]